MPWGVVATILFGSLLVLLATGLPIAFCFLLVNFVAMYFIMGPSGPSQLILSIFSNVGQFPLTPLPLFILMGEIMFHSGMAKRVLDALDSLLGGLPGRLGAITVVTGAIFAGLSGSAVANTALLGSMLLPDMLDRRYNRRFSLGTIMGSGSLAMMMPHSSLTIIFATVALLPVGTMLIATTLPGLLVTALFLIYVICICLVIPNLAPRMVRVDNQTSPLKKVLIFSRDIVPIVAIIILTVVVIFYGVATPTEAAALGALCSIILAICYNSFNFEVIKLSATKTLYLSSMILMIVAGSSAYSEVLAYTTVTKSILHAVLSSNMSTTTIVIIMLLLVFVLTMFMEEMSIIMITVPIFMPLISALHVNPIWFGILVMIMLEKGLITPPAGLVLYVMKGVAPAEAEISVWDVWVSALPYVAIILIALVLVFVHPNIALYLPNKMH